MSASTSAPAPSAPPTSPTILLFARGVYSLFHLWPALRLAVSQQWGGDDSAEKRIWFISVVVDEFEEKSLMPSSVQATAAALGEIANDAEGVTVPPPTGCDLDSVADMLYDIMMEEFSIDLEDDSPVEISRRLIKLWSDASKGLESEVVKLEEEESKMGKSKVVASQGADEEDDDDSGSDSGSEEEEAAGGSGQRMEGVQEEAPQLVQRREEPEVDDDGFTMVKGKGKKGGK